MFGESANGSSIMNPMSQGTIGLFDTGNELLAMAFPVLYMFGESGVGPSVIDPMSRGTIGLIDTGMGNGLLAVTYPLV